jgi:hypothetical protein
VGWWAYGRFHWLVRFGSVWFGLVRSGLVDLVWFGSDGKIKV